MVKRKKVDKCAVATGQGRTHVERNNCEKHLHGHQKLVFPAVATQEKSIALWRLLKYKIAVGEWRNAKKKGLMDKFDHITRNSCR